MPNHLPSPHTNGNVNAVDVLGTLPNLTFRANNDLLLKLVRSRGQDECVYLQYWIESDTADDVFAFADVAEPLTHFPSLRHFNTAQQIRSIMRDSYLLAGFILEVKTIDGEETVAMLFQNKASGDYTIVIGVIETGALGIYPMDTVNHATAHLDDFS